MGVIKSVENLLKKNKFTNKLISQYGFRTVVFSACSFVFNSAYAVFNGVIAVLNLSVWYGALTVYYLIFALMRGRILLFHGKKHRGVSMKYGDKEYELLLYGRCGIWLIVLHLCLPAATVQMSLANTPISHTNLMVYVSAIWTGYKIVMAGYNIYRSRRDEDMTVRALRNINFADALVSLLTLQLVIYRVFMPEYNATLSNALTTGIVSLVTVFMGIYMVTRSHRMRKSGSDGE